jgi:DNA-binding transcriptional LysR family regulator
LKPSAVGSALVTFVHTADAGSFAAAAKVMNVTPAAVGQTLKRLEDHFGVKLINRTTRRMSLTPEGQVLLGRCRAPLSELSEISRAFDETRGIVAGPLRISAPLGFARQYLTPLISAFNQRHPRAEIELDSTDSIRDFVKNPVDVSFRILRPTDSTVIARPISRLQAVTVASPDYLARVGPPRHPRDLQHHACIIYRYPTSGELSDLRFRIGGRETIFQVRPTLVINDVEIGCDFAARGMGIIQPPSNYVAPYVDDGRLVPLLTAYVAHPWTIYLCYPGRENLPLRVREFIKFALVTLGRDKLLMSFDGHNNGAAGARAKRTSG